MRHFLILIAIIIFSISSGWSQQSRFMPGINFDLQTNKLSKKTIIEEGVVFTSRDFENNSSSQRDTECLLFQGGPYFDIEIPPCDANCGTPLAAGFQVWGNEAYVITATAGSEYTFSFCNGYNASTWPAIITVAEYNGIFGAVPQSEIISTTGCSATFVTPEDKNYIIVVSVENSCGGPYVQTNNGFVTIDCGPNGATCYACTAGSLSEEGPLEVCPGEIIEVSTNNDQIIPTSGGYGWNFVPGPDGTGGPFSGSSFTFVGAPTGNMWGSNLDGSLGNSVLQGTWVIIGFSYDDANDIPGTICESTSNNLVVNFLDSIAAPCAPPDSISNVDSTGAVGVCQMPYNLRFDTRWPDTVIVSWEGNADRFDLVLLNITDGEVFTGVPTDTNVTSPDTITGLTPETLYAIYVRGQCDGIDLVLSGVLNATLPPSGLPKMIELFAVKDIDDLSEYAVGSANNGEGSDGPEFTLSGSADRGDHIYVSSTSAEFDAWFGFLPDYVNSVAEINGDDAVELFNEDGEVIDVFGEIDVDGTGEPWEYTNGWAYRKNNTGPDSSTFVLSNWRFSGSGAILVGDLTNATCNSPYPFGTFLSSGGGGGGGGGTSPWNYDSLSTFIINGEPTCIPYKWVNCITDIDEDGSDALENTAPSGCSPSGVGFWYKFRGNGLDWVITATPQSSDISIKILEGDCDSLFCIVEENSSVLTETLLFDTERNKEYYMRIGSNNLSTSNISDFNLNIRCTPENDVCVDAPVIRVGAQGTCNEGVGFVSASTTDASDNGLITCDPLENFDLWYKFTANSEAVSFKSLTGNPGIEIYEGSCDSLGGSIGCIDNESGIISGLTNGTEYYAAIWTDEEKTTISFCLEKFIPETIVENDTCEGAITVTCDTDIEVDGSDATINGSPGRACKESGAGLWYTFEGDGQDWEVIATPESSDIQIQIYSGACDNLVCVDDVDDSPLEEILEVSTNIGENYFIYIAGVSESRPDIGMFDLKINCSAPAPENDECEDATVLVCNAAALTGQTTNGSIAESDPNSCASNYGVWYTFVGNGDDVTITSANNTFDHELSVFSSNGGCGGTFTTVVCANNSTGAETTAFSSMNGTQYYIYIAHASSSSTSTGLFDIGISCTPPVIPDNNTCEDAISIAACDVVYGTTLNASFDAGLDNCGTSVNSAPGVWYSFSGTGNEVAFSLCDDTTNFNSKLAVYEGSCNNLVCVSANDDACGSASEIDINTTVGSNYYIYVTGINTEFGNFGLSVTSAAENDSITINTGSCNPDDVGTESVTFTNSNGCDSIITTVTELVTGFNDTIYSTTCSLNNVGEVIDSTLSEDDCDSITVTITSLLSSLVSTNEETSCDVNETGTVIDTLVAFNGCDSLSITVTSFSEIDSVTISTASCNPLNVGSESVTLTNTAGCDSVVTTITGFVTSFSDTIYLTSCTLDMVGEVVDSAMSVDGCDSITVTSTSLLPSLVSTDELFVCNLDGTGTETDTLVASDGCDSLHITITSLLPSLVSTEELTSCNANEAGTVADTLMASDGCDSLHITITSLLASDLVIINATSCDPNEIGTDTVVLSNANGCDSVVITNTTFGSYVEISTIYTCEIDEAGTVIDTFQNANSCDSIIQTNTIFRGVIASFDYAMVDSSVQFFNESENADSYLWEFGDGNTSAENNPNHSYAESGGYGVHLTASNDYCSDTFFAAIEVNLPVGIGLNNLIESIILYPNPNDGSFEVELKSRNYAAQLDLTLYSMNGKVIDTRTVDFNGFVKEKYSYNELTSGFYFLQIQDGENKLVLKIEIVN